MATTVSLDAGAPVTQYLPTRPSQTITAVSEMTPLVNVVAVDPAEFDQTPVEHARYQQQNTKYQPISSQGPTGPCATNIVLPGVYDENDVRLARQNINVVAVDPGPGKSSNKKLPPKVIREDLPKGKPLKKDILTSLLVNKVKTPKGKKSKSNDDQLPKARSDSFQKTNEWLNNENNELPLIPGGVSKVNVEGEERPRAQIPVIEVDMPPPQPVVPQKCVQHLEAPVVRNKEPDLPRESIYYMFSDIPEDRPRQIAEVERFLNLPSEDQSVSTKHWAKTAVAEYEGNSNTSFSESDESNYIDAEVIVSPRKCAPKRVPSNRSYEKVHYIVPVEEEIFVDERKSNRRVVRKEPTEAEYIIYASAPPQRKTSTPVQRNVALPAQRNVKTQMSDLSVRNVSSGTQIQMEELEPYDSYEEEGGSDIVSVEEFVTGRSSNRDMSTQTLQDQGTQTMQSVERVSSIKQSVERVSSIKPSRTSRTSRTTSKVVQSEPVYEVKKEKKKPKKETLKKIDKKVTTIEKKKSKHVEIVAPAPEDPYKIYKKEPPREEFQPKRTGSFTVPDVLKPRSELRVQIEPEGMVAENLDSGDESLEDDQDVPTRKTVQTRRLSQLDQIKKPILRKTEEINAEAVKPLVRLHHRPQLLSLFSIREYHDNPKMKCRPSGLCIAPNGNYIITDFSDRTVKVFNRMGQLKVEFGQDTLKRPWCATILADGNLAVTDPGDTAVKVFSRAGKFLKKFEFSDLVEPYGITKSSTGDVLVADKGANGIYVFSQDGFLKGSLNSEEPFAEWPQHVVADKDDNIIVTDYMTHKLKIFSPRGELQHEHGGMGTGTAQLMCPQGVCVDNHGHILVADNVNNRVKMLSPDGQFVRDLVTQKHGLDSPEAIAVDRDGNLVVTQGNGEVKIFKYVN